jgi:hypothetical protein
MANEPSAISQKGLLIFLLAQDGIFEVGDIWSVIHRQSYPFDYVLLDQNQGKTKVPPTIKKAALNTIVVGPDKPVGKAINILAKETDYPYFAFSSDRVNPTHEHWLKRLFEPLLEGESEASFGREIPSPGGNYFFIDRLNKLFPGADKTDEKGFSIDNCATVRQSILKKPFPESDLYDTAFVWQAINGIKASYCHEAIVMRFTLWNLSELYQLARARGNDLAAKGEKISLLTALWQLLYGIGKDIVFAFSLFKPQFIWYPFIYRPVEQLGLYLGANRQNK